MAKEGVPQTTCDGVPTTLLSLASRGAGQGLCYVSIVVRGWQLALEYVFSGDVKGC